MIRKQRKKPADDITLHDVVNHMSHHFMLLDGKMNKLDGRMDKLDKRVGRLEVQIHVIDTKLTNFHKEFKEFAKGVDDLDYRVQDLEELKIKPRLIHLETSLSSK